MSTAEYKLEEVQTNRGDIVYVFSNAQAATEIQEELEGSMGLLERYDLEFSLIGSMAYSVGSGLKIERRYQRRENTLRVDSDDEEANNSLAALLNQKDSNPVWDSTAEMLTR